MWVPSHRSEADWLIVQFFSFCCCSGTADRRERGLALDWTFSGLQPPTLKKG